MKMIIFFFYTHYKDQKCSRYSNFAAAEFCIMYVPVSIQRADHSEEEGLCPCLVVHISYGISCVSVEVQIITGLHNCSGMLEF